MTLVSDANGTALFQAASSVALVGMPLRNGYVWFVIPHWMRDPSGSPHGPRIESGVTALRGNGCSLHLSPQTVPKAVDKSMNNRGKPHPVWCGVMCLKIGHS
jgi:hypothetical protein